MRPKNNRMYLKTITEIGDTSFRDFTAIGGAPFSAIVGLVVLSFKEYLLFQQLLIGFFITLFIVVVIRLIYFKNRPLKQRYNNLLEKIDASSFPSLHAARILFLTLTMANFFKQKNVTIVLLIIAALISYSRIYLKKHDWIDVIAGLILGGATYFIFI